MPFKDKSAVVKETNANITEYNHSVKVPLNIKDKTCQRVFKRQSAKVEVWNFKFFPWNWNSWKNPISYQHIGIFPWK